VLLGNKQFKTPTERFNFRAKCYKLLPNNRVGREIKEVTKQVVALKEMFETIYEVHAVKRGHQGINKCNVILNQRYHGVTRNILENFRKFCYICDLKETQKTQPRLTPIISSKIFERAQLDLIDMRCNPDGEWCWIGHMMDHSGQFHVLWPQKHKNGMC